MIFYGQQPKSGFLPEAGRGGPEFPGPTIRGGANGAGQSAPRPPSRPSPSA